MLAIFGFIDTPVTNYVLFYGLLGVLGFLACRFRGYLIIAAIPLIIWFSVSEIQWFYHSIKVRPDNTYIAIAMSSMVFAVIASGIGAAWSFRRRIKDEGEESHLMV